MAGKPLLDDNSIDAALGAFYSAHGPTPKDAEEAEIATQKSFRQGGTRIKPGLGFLDIALEPQMLNDNRWGRLFSLAYAHPDRPAFVLTRDMALEVGPAGAQALGDNVVFALDLGEARLALGEREALAIANGLLDVFAAGEAVRPRARQRGRQPGARRHPGAAHGDPRPDAHAYAHSVTRSDRDSRRDFDRDCASEQHACARPDAVCQQAAARGHTPGIRRNWIRPIGASRRPGGDPGRARRRAVPGRPPATPIGVRDAPVIPPGRGTRGRVLRHPLREQVHRTPTARRRHR